MKQSTLGAVVCISISISIVLTGNICRAQEKEVARQQIELEGIEIWGEKEARPYSLFILTEKEIKKESPADTGDVLKKVPGIATRRTGLWGQEPTLRGLKEDQVNLLIDGAKVWGACPGRMDPPTSQVSPEELEAIEIIRGPFSVRHGAGTLGGVINLKTKKPRSYEKPQINGSLKLGYDGVAAGEKGSLNIYGGDRSYDYRLSAGTRRFNDYDTPRGKIDNSGFEEAGYSAKFGLNRANHRRLDFSVSQNLRRDVGHPARSMDSEQASNSLTSIKYSQEQLSPWLASLTGKIYYNTAEHVMNNDQRSSFNTMAMETEAESHTSGGKVETVWEVGKNSRLASGIDYYNLRRDADRTRIMKTGMPMTMKDKPWNKARINDWGLYGELQSAVSPDLELQLGARVDLVQANSNLPDQNFLTLVNGADLKQEEVNLSGNLGLAYAASEHLKLKAAVGRGVRTADANERYSNFFPSSKYLDNFEYLGDPNLDPEKSLEFDLGAQIKHERLNLELTLFYNQVQDYISARTDSGLTPKSASSAGVKRYVNIDARLMGFEMQAGLKISQELSLKGNLAYTEGENEDSDTYLPQIPPLAGNLTLRYDYGSKGLWAECSARFVDDQNKLDPAFTETRTSGFSTFGFALGMTPFENYHLIAGVQNIFDKEYSEHLNGTNTTTGGKLLEPGRNIFARLEWQFQ